jgi:hypothetical protein
MGLLPIPGEGSSGTPIPLPPFPLPPSGGSGSPGGSVTGALGSIISWVGSALGWTQGYANALLGGLENALKQIFAQIVSLFQYLAQTWLGQIIKSIWNKLAQIFAAVSKELKLILKEFQEYEKLVRYWENKILGPILNVIQALRKTLVIFKLFHLKFASQLDNYLSGIEGRLVNIFLFYQRELNYIIDAIDLIVDPFGLISEGLFIQSAVRSIGAVWAGVMGYPSSGITPAQTAAAQARTQFYTATSQKDYMKGLAAGGTNPDDQAIIDAQTQGYAELGYKV